MKINEKKLYELYMEKVNRISEDLEWKTQFSPEEIVHMIVMILQNNPNLIEKE